MIICARMATSSGVDYSQIQFSVPLGYAMLLHNFYNKIIFILKKYLTLKMRVKVMKHNIRNGAIRLKISIFIKVTACIFMLTLTVIKILTFQIFDLENLGQGLGVQHFVVLPFSGIYQSL